MPRKIDSAAPCARKYIYAVIPARPGRKLDFVGIDERPLETIERGGIASVVSGLAAERIRPERRHLSAHRAVLAKLIEQEDAVLPMRFGAIASGAAEIGRLNRAQARTLFAPVAPRGGQSRDGLARSLGCTQHFSILRQRSSRTPRAPRHYFLQRCRVSHEERIELGRTFERLLNESREANTRLAEEVLAAHRVEIRRNRVREEKEIMNLACLVEKDRREDFERGVLATAQRFDNSFAFDYNGPWAPHTFAEINLKS
ncbi:MAG TPA: GvpL/GvpF family gas vesicle protein [Candidatus Binataceae bacterium]|nr:GvpL/GvpF family gas vesicle protein [Candidatus Binataceae bacterium]